MALLEVKNLDVRFAVRGGDLTALRRISFSLDKGERLGLVGESGAGKSVAAFSILNLIAKPGYIAGGQILFEGKDLAAMSERELRKIRGNRIAMIFQDPMMTLNPVLTIGTQMVEAILAHRKISKKEARDQTDEEDKQQDTDEKKQVRDRQTKTNKKGTGLGRTPCVEVPPEQLV